MVYLPAELDSLFRGESSREEAPYVGVVGPPGCGKTRLLADLAVSLRSSLGDSEADTVLRVNLAEFPVSDADEMLAQLTSRIRAAAPRGLGGRLRRGRRETIVDDLDLLLEGLLDRKPGRLTLLLDGFDRIPRTFARAVSRRFRGYWEDRDCRGEFNRLGLVVAGALSLLDLKREVDSAISLSHMVVLPWAEVETRREQVKEALGRAGWDLGDDLVARLASETGGEPAFLDPVLREVESRAGREPNLKALREVVEDAGWICSHLPVLEHVLLGFCSDLEVQGVVRSLCGSPAGIPAGPGEEVDRLQLMGCVLVERAGADSIYRFRNAIVERFFRELTAGVAVHVTIADEGWADIAARAGIDPGRVFESAMLAGRLRAEAAAAVDLWGCLSKVQKAFEVLTGFADSRLKVVVFGGGQSLYLLDADDESVKIRPRTASAELTRLMEAVRKVRQPYIALERKRGMVALPLSGRRPGILIAELSSTAVARGFSESSLDNWSRWIGVLRKVISLQAVTQLGVTVIDGKFTQEQVGLIPADDLPAERSEEDPRHAEVRSSFWLDSQRELNRWRFGSAIGIALLVSGCLYFGWHFVTAHIEELDRIANVVSLIVPLLGFLGTLIFGSRFIKLRDEYEYGLVSRIYRRRLRSAHLMDLMGGGPPPQTDSSLNTNARGQSISAPRDRSLAGREAE